MITYDRGCLLRPSLLRWSPVVLNLRCSWFYVSSLGLLWGWVVVR